MIESEAIELLLHKIASRYGYDFSDYARASLHRRIDLFYNKNKQPSFALMQERLMQDPVFFMSFVEQITVNVTEMFRDANFYKMLREHVLPMLATYPFIRIWHAGCSTGEEVFSLAIILREAGLLHKSILYATDINQAVLAQAKTGVFPISSMQLNSENYIRSGGREDFSIYYNASHDSVKFDPALSEKMIFSTHNLVADASFNEFQLILCRNVLIYFNRELQAKVLQLFDRSLESLGFLALGSKESLKFSPIAGYYKQILYNEKVWRKNK